MPAPVAPPASPSPSSPMITVSDAGEAALLARIRTHVPASRSDVLVGIGDDAAVLEPPRGALLVQTTDTLIDRVHVDRRFMSARDIGRRAVAVNVSDLAAMGARPSWIVLALTLPGDLSVDDFDALIRGVVDEARLHGADLVGGNLSAAPGAALALDVTATGAVRPRRVLRRDTARAGDALWVTGHIGAAAAGLQMLRADAAATGPCVDRYRVPTPRLREAWGLAAARAARAAIDVSDGLAASVRQLAAASGLGARIAAASLPIEPGARAWFEQHGVDAVTASLATSDDYELLFAAPPKFSRRLEAVQRHTGTPFTRIGELTRDGGCVLAGSDGEVPLPAGFEHLRT